ncbi:MAG: hypothetical protein KF862_18385 [Chitinophagaceae bacterium]|nr:hypothetical protein [Chitinophagaceae bacterium]
MGDNTAMTTLSGVLNELKNRNQDREFYMKDDLFTLDDTHLYAPGDLKIIKTYRFEGDSNPDDSSILYLIQTNDGETGFVIDAYGVYSNFESEKHNHFIRQIPVEHPEA